MRLVGITLARRGHTRSIASSPKKTTGEIHLAVAVVRYRLRDRERGGVASTFLSDRLSPGEAVPVYVNPADNFRLPAPDRPVIMIGPGTGIAPFRAFLEERQTTGAGGRNWLFFANPRRGSDFLFEDELTAYCRDGLLTRLDTQNLCPASDAGACQRIVGVA